MTKPRGPVPKPSSQRRRRNKPKGATPVKAPARTRPVVPSPDPEWHSIALDWFNSLKDSGQAQFYEASDWASARYVAEAMSRNLNQGQKFSSMLFSAVMAGMTELLTTEGARRRARVELERAAEPEKPASVSIMEDYRRDAGRKRVSKDSA